MGGSGVGTFPSLPFFPFSTMCVNDSVHFSQNNLFVKDPTKEVEGIQLEQVEFQDFRFCFCFFVSLFQGAEKTHPLYSLSSVRNRSAPLLEAPSS